MNTKNLRKTTTLAVALTALLVLVILYLNASIFIFFTAFCFQSLLVFIYIDYRYTWICNARLKLVPRWNYDRLISFNDMLYNYIFTYDINKMMKN